MANFFQKVRLAKPEKNWFDLSHDVKTTLDFGALTPVLCAPAYPGDRFKVSIEHLIRFAPMLAPVFNKFDVRFDSFFYPTRLVWDKSQDFYRGGKDGQTDVPVPMIGIADIVRANARFFKYSDTADGIGGSGYHFNINSLSDYLNLPTFDELIQYQVEQNTTESGGSTTYPQYDDIVDIVTQIVSSDSYNQQVSIIPFLMYQGIYREYYRDQFLQPDVDDLSDTSIGQLGTGAVLGADIDADDIVSVLANNPVTGSSTQQAKRASILSALLDLKLVNYPKDYFTSALPSPQLGPSVSLPIGDIAVGTSDGSNTAISSSSVARSAGYRTLKLSANNKALVAMGDFVEGTIPDFRRVETFQEIPVIY